MDFSKRFSERITFGLAFVLFSLVLYAYFSLADTISVNTNASGYVVQQMPTVGGEIMNRWNRAVWTPVIAAYAVPTNGLTPQIPWPATPSAGSDYVSCCIATNQRNAGSIWFGNAPLPNATPGTDGGIEFLPGMPVVCFAAVNGDCTGYKVAATPGVNGVTVVELNK